MPATRLAAVLACALCSPPGSAQVTYHFATTVGTIDPSAPGFPASLAHVAVGAPIRGLITYDGASPSAPNPFGGTFGQATYYPLLNARIEMVVGDVPFSFQTRVSAFVWNDTTISGSPSDGLIFTNIALVGTPQVQIGNLLLATSTFAGTGLPTASVPGRFLVELGDAGRTTTWVSGNWSGLALAPAASYRTIGPGCPGALGVPGNRATALPVIGQSLALDLTNLPRSTAFLLLGASDTTSALGPLPFDLGAFGARGCLLRVSNDLSLPVAGANGAAAVTLPIPFDPALVGATVFTQCVVPDPAANPLGATLSDAAAAAIGS